MGGSTVAQFLYDEYHTSAVQVAAQLTNNMLSAIVPWVQLALAFYVLVVGKRLLTAGASLDETATKFARVMLVTFMLTPANYNTYITTFATQTIPNAINGAVSGQQNQSGAQLWDSLFDQVDKFAATIRTQATGFFLYFSERVVIWFATGSADVVIGLCLVIWLLSTAAIAFIVPVGAILLLLYLFDATREFTMRWIGKLVSLFLVMLFSLMLGAFVVKADGNYIQKYGQTVAANATNPNFSTNAGGNATIMMDSGFGIMQVPANNPTTTANVDAAISTLWKIVVVFGFGLFLMSTMVVIALFIGGSTGFSAAPAIGLLVMGGAAGARRAAKLAAAAARSGRRAFP